MASIIKYGSTLYIGMNDVSQNHAHTTFTFNVNSVPLLRNGSYGQRIYLK